MSNKQPFYHSASVTFTCTEPLDKDEFISAIQHGLKALKCGYVKESVQIEEWTEPEAGDPDDLM
jgi:hypothetical protein